MILALQYYEGDQERAMSLARLLADIEPSYRDDVVLALVCQPGTRSSDLVRATMERCSRKFPIQHVVSRRGAEGWADGSGQLWAGTMEHFHGARGRAQLSFGTIFTFDGNDGVPLHNNWIDLLKEEHGNTLRMGKFVSGELILDIPSHPHINGNMIVELSMLDSHPELLDIPLGATLEGLDTWDMRNAPIFLPCASASTIVYSRWNRTGVSKEIMGQAALNSVWFHGFKDDCLCDMARERLLCDMGGSSTFPLIRRQVDEMRLILGEFP